MAIPCILVIPVRLKSKLHLTKTEEAHSCKVAKVMAMIENTWVGEKEKKIPAQH